MSFHDTRGNLTPYVQAAKARVASGQLPDNICGWLYAEGLSLIECIKAMVLTYGISIGAAKLFVESRAPWLEEHERQEKFRDEMQRALFPEGEVTERKLSDEELERYYPRILYPEGR